MHRAILAVLLCSFPVRAAPAPVSAPAAPTLSAEDESLLRSAGLEVTGPELLELFGQRATHSADVALLDRLTRELAGPDAGLRERAKARLMGLGPLAVPALRRAANDPRSKEGAPQARACLELLEGSRSAELTRSAVRALVVRRPPGATGALLRYLPRAEGEAVIEEIRQGLVTLGKLALYGQASLSPDEASRLLDADLVAALGDEEAIRRGTAAQVLAELLGGRSGPLLRPLLNDAAPAVRLEAALALLRHHDPAAAPALIEILGEPSGESWPRAEEALEGLAGEWAIKAPQGNDPLSRRLRKQVWAAWWQGIDDAQLLHELRSRTMSDAEYRRFSGLIGQLGAGDAAAREAAFQAFLEGGRPAAALLRRAARDRDGEARDLAARCVEAIEQREPLPPVPDAVLSLLAARQPPGTLEALLGYLPFAEEREQERIDALLEVLGFAGGKVDPLLVQGMSGPVAARRACAASVLCRVGPDAHLPAARVLLRDPDPQVRLAVGLALAGRGEKTAVPPLIDLLGELPLREAWEVEDFLTSLAQQTGPQALLTEDPAARKQCRDAWAAWWQGHGGQVDLRVVTARERRLGYLLVVESYNPGTRTGRVLELDRQGKVRWEISALRYPMGAQVLARDRVLVAEQGANQVTERDMSGKVLWSLSLPSPFHCERARDGSTLVAGRSQIQVVDRAGKVLLSHPMNGQSILAARWLRGGHIAYVTYQGEYTRLDASGKAVKSFRVPFDPRFGVAAGEVLPGDRVLISSPQQNKVTEYDEAGKARWEAAVPGAGSPYRLDDGRTLVVGGGSTRICEVDRAGKVIAEKANLPFRPWRVVPR